jgi:hypothetical protein
LTEATTYYWRTKSVNLCGTESDWSSALLFTTLLSTLKIPVLNGPVNEATCQPISPSLSWNAVENASSYTIEVDDNEDFSSPEYTGSCTGVNHNCSALTENSTFYWRVAAEGDCETESEWSESWKFETGSSGLDAPSLNEPGNNSTDQELTLSLRWTPVANATSYFVQLDDNDDYSSPLYNEEVSVTEMQINDLQEGTDYYWQVRAVGECTSGDWSESWEFQTRSAEEPEDPEDPNALQNSITTEYYLGPNKPNPFMETTSIDFSIPVDEKVIIELIDLDGRIIEKVTGYFSAGKHTVEINLQRKANAGVYLYRMRTVDYTDTRLCVVK